jgi:hypothetical protein
MPASSVSSCRQMGNTDCRCSAADFDCPHGVAPGRMPKADATGLAPKKSADTTLPYRFVCAGGFGFAFCPRTDHPSGKRIQPSQSQKTAPPFLWWSPPSGGLGLKTRRSPGCFCWALRFRFLFLPPPGYRSRLHKRVPYPTRTPTPTILR